MFIIISSENIEELKRDISTLNLDYKEVEGMYQGTKEISLLVPDVYLNYGDVIDLAKKHDQESALFVDDKNRASLIFMENEEMIDIGHWVKVQCVTGDVDAYTKIDNDYFVCLK